MEQETSVEGYREVSCTCSTVELQEKKALLEELKGQLRCHLESQMDLILELGYINEEIRIIRNRYHALDREIFEASVGTLKMPARWKRSKKAKKKEKSSQTMEEAVSAMSPEMRAELIKQLEKMHESKS
jgi:hypothetical protein